ncbi:MAG TPA: hypothetical protein VGA61_17670 [Anaerolineae bacterium]
MRNIRVVEYDVSWPAAFQREAMLLAAIFGEELVTIHLTQAGG